MVSVIYDRVSSHVRPEIENEPARKTKIAIKLAKKANSNCDLEPNSLTVGDSNVNDTLSLVTFFALGLATTLLAFL